MKTCLIFIVIMLFCIRGNAQYFSWAKQVNSAGLLGQGYAVTIDALGNSYTIGTFTMTVDFDPGPGVFNLTAAGSDIFVLKLDAAGNFIWAKAVGGNWQDVGYSISLDAACNVYIGGSFSDTADFDPGPGVYNLRAPGTENAFVEKLDSSGNFIWAKQIGDSSSYEAGGTYVAADSTGNVYVAGSFIHTVDFDPGPGSFYLSSRGLDAFALKLDAVGNFIWAKQIGDTLWDGARAIAIDKAGNVYVGGIFQGTVDFDPGPGSYYLSTGVNNTAFISKLNSSGGFVWAKELTGTGESIDNAIIVDNAENVYTTGYFTGTIDFDPGPSSFNLTSVTYESDIFVEKLDATGALVWVKQMGGTGRGSGNSIFVDGKSNVYTAGAFLGTTDFDPGPGSFNLTSVNWDMYVSMLDSLGNFAWALQIGGTDYDKAASIAGTTSGDLFLTGYFSDTVDFDPGPGSYYMLSPQPVNIFVEKLSSSSLPLAMSQPERDVQPLIYPVPSGGRVTINCEDLIHSITVTDLAGKIVFESAPEQKSTAITFETGVYFTRIITDAGSWTRKVVVVR